MRRGAAWVVAVVLTCLVGVLGYLAWAERDDRDDDANELAAAVKGATVSLEQGLALAEAQGTPISAKFEAEDEVSQLSIYVLAGAAFSEILLDPKTGRIIKATPLTDGDALRAAQRQADSVAKATASLRAAAESAALANEGFRGVSITPALSGDHPVAEVTLLKGRTFKTVWEKLD